MISNTSHHSLKSALITATVLASSLTYVAPAVAEYNIGALACQAPHLDQAQFLRWHEHYVINPANSQTTWIVCPIAFDTIKLPQQFRIGAFGNSTVPGINALCYANVIDLRNQHIPTFDFLTNPGQDMSYQQIMSTKNPSNTLWSSWVDTSVPQISASMMDPPSTPVDENGVKGPAYWTITVNCQLKPGQSLNMVSLWPAPTQETGEKLHIGNATAKWEGGSSTSPMNAIDGDTSTGYYSGGTHDFTHDKNMWWEGDLGSVQATTKVRLVWANIPNPAWKEIEIFGSTDGSSYSKILNNSRVNVDGSWSEFDVSGSFRFVRLKFVGSGSGDHGLDLMEFEVY